MNIWLIQTGEPLPLDKNVRKMRTAVLADKLVEKGHSVLWWTSAFDHFKKKWIFNKNTELELSKNYKIYALRGLGYKKNISLSRFIDHRIIARKFKNKAVEVQKPDIVVASLPSHDLAYESVMFAERNNIPIIVDIRDPWPDILLDHIPQKLKDIAKMLFLMEFQMIKKTMRAATGLSAVTSTLLDWGLKYASRGKRQSDNVYYLGYKKPLMNNFSSVNKSYLQAYKRIKDKFIVLFIGTISNAYHNPSILLKAAEMLIHNKNIHFVIAGDGESLTTLINEATGLNNVTFTGWLNQEEIEFWLQNSKIGVCPVAKKVDFPTNKAYAYLSAGLPIISAFQGDIKGVIEKYEIGFYYPPGDVNMLVNHIKMLYNNTTLHKDMSKRALKAFLEKFDADKIYDDYALHIESIAMGCKKEDV
jgi:glycosyltransferase involved in cell wall biosynthesis